MTRAEVLADVHQQIYALVQAQIDANDRALVESIAAGDLDIDDAAHLSALLRADALAKAPRAITFAENLIDGLAERLS